MPNLGNVRTVVGGIPETGGQQIAALLMGLVAKALERLGLGNTAAADEPNVEIRGKESANGRQEDS